MWNLETLMVTKLIPGAGSFSLVIRNLLQKVLKTLISFKIPHKWKLEYDNVGYNYRMPSINAAIDYRN